MAVPATSLFTISKWSSLGHMIKRNRPNSSGFQCRTHLSAFFRGGRRATAASWRPLAPRLVRDPSFNNNLTLEQPLSAKAACLYPHRDRRPENRLT
jgi:hypothetical protein